MRNLLTAGLKRFRSNEVVWPTGARRAVVIAVAAQKGGVGKTTTAVHLGCALAEQQRRVLVLDMDAQAHVAASLRQSLRFGQTTLSDVLLATRPRDLMEAVVNSDIDGLSLTPPDKGLGDTETQLTSRVGREYLLQGVLRTARTHFDAIILDCPPNLGNLTLNALVASDYVLVPCDMSILALEGVADLLRTIATVRDRLRQPVELLGILRTRVDPRNLTVNAEVGAILEDDYGPLVLSTVIPQNSALAKAQVAGLSVMQCEPRSRSAAAYRALGDEVLSRLEACRGNAARER